MATGNARHDSEEAALELDWSDDERAPARTQRSCRRRTKATATTQDDAAAAAAAAADDDDRWWVDLRSIVKALARAERGWA
jgi:hypothetical protein